METVKQSETTAGLLRPRIIKSNRKSITLVIDESGELIVRAPRFVSDREIMKLVEAKRDWIIKRRQEIEKTDKLKQELIIKNGSVIPFMGEDRTISIGEYRRIMLTETEIQVPMVHDPEKVFRKWVKMQALYTLQESVEHYAEQMGLSYENVKLSTARTSWGTCTSKRVLRFSWRLILCPIEILDYVVVHELSHIRHMNHSQEFWTCVAAVLPDHKNRRKWLKAHAYYMDF